MASTARSSSTGQFTIASSDGKWTVRDSKSGRVLPLKGYGSMKGKLEFARDVDLTKPIAAQVKVGRSQNPKSGATTKRH